MLLGFLFWLVMKIAPERDGKGKSSKPSHFTIPILSPFTSVVRCLLFLVPVRHCDLRGVGGAREWRPWSQDGCYFGLGHGYRSVRCVETSAFTVAHGINLETLLQPVFVTCWTRSRGPVSAPRESRPVLEEFATVTSAAEMAWECICTGTRTEMSLVALV